MKCFVRPHQQHSLCTLRLFRIIVLGFVVVLQFTSEWLRIRVHVASVPVQVLEKERNESALIDGLSQSVSQSPPVIGIVAQRNFTNPIQVKKKNGRKEIPNGLLINSLTCQFIRPLFDCCLLSSWYRFPLLLFEKWEARRMADPINRTCIGLIVSNTSH